jgi:outer membrane receptor protein involved in Fe transport
MKKLHVFALSSSRSSRFKLFRLSLPFALLAVGGFATCGWAQTDPSTDQDAEDKTLEEVVVVGTQIKGAAISEALSVSVISSADIETLGISSGQELLDYMPEQGQNFVNEAENISGGVNSARGDIGAFNLRNMGTGNTLVLLNGRRMVQAAGYQTEEVGGSFVPVNSVNSNAIPVFGIERVEVLRDGASAIYGADAVAGVVNTVLKNDFEGLTFRARFDEYDNIPRNDYRANIEWGQFFNEGRTNVGVFADFYHRDRVNAQDDDRWADSDFRYRVPEDSLWSGLSDWRNDSANSLYGQFDMSGSVSGITDGSGEFETYPLGDPRCDEDSWVINEVMCGRRDGQGTYRYNLNENRDLASELDRYNVFLYMNHEFDNGLESFTEFAYYTAETNLLRHPATFTSGLNLFVGAENYYNPFGPCGSPNRLPDAILGENFPCGGRALRMDNYRFAELPRIVDTENTTWRFLTGLRGSWGEWDWESALLWSEADRDDVTHNRISNNLMEEALNDPTAAAYNPFNGGILPSNIERALVDVYRKNETDLKMFDFKLSTPDLFNLPAGPVGFLAGVEYRDESFKDDRDPRLDGTIPWTSPDGETYPYVSDVINSSPSSDSAGSRDVTSLFTEFAVPVWSSDTAFVGTMDLQLAMRYEDLSDVGDTTVGKVAFGWRPFEPFLVRGSWSEAFRAPNLITVNEGLVVRQNTRTDYVCLYADPNEDVLDCNYGIQRRASGSEDLEPEKSDNTSIGFVWDIVDSLTVTLDFWSIEKQDTIGLFGEENHASLDLLLRLQAGNSNCSQPFNPAVGREAPDDDQIAVYTAAGLCPAGDIAFIDDKYANLDTRTVEGHDIGVYWDIDTGIGDFSFQYVGTFYDTYKQTPGPLSQRLLDAANAGLIPPGSVTGFGDLIGQDGNQDEKHNASIRWRKGAWGASLSGYKLGSFYQSSLTLGDGTKYVIPSMTTYNASFDYRFDLFNADNRIRLGINNFTDERAPLADRYFGYFSDAHSDYGRYFYLDLRMAWR